MTVKKFHGISNLTQVQLIFRGFWFLKNLQTGKTSSHVLMFSLSRHYNTLEPAYVWKYFEILWVKGQDKLQDTTVNSLKVNIYVNFWTKFLLNNRQALELNRQRQSYATPIETLSHLSLRGRSSWDRH